MFKINDYVSRISYNHDVIFKIINIENDVAILEGYDKRLIATANIFDLVLVDKNRIQEVEEAAKLRIKGIKKSSRYKLHMTGKILHIDADKEYLEKCLSLYKELNIYAYGVVLRENQMYKEVINLIRKSRPNIVVLTGHDSYNNKEIKDLNNYKNTINFLKAVIKIRETYSLDDICIYAGACGSNFEALIAAGANFASSIDRKNIEAYDPAIVAVLAAITPFNQIIDIKNLYSFSKMKKGSIGGIETYGKMRLLAK